MAGSWANQSPATSAFTKVARNRPSGAEVYSKRAGFDALILGHDFRDHGRARGPFTADAEARDDAEDDELPHLGDEGAGGGAERVEQHRDHQHALAAEAIAIGPKITPPAAQPSSSREFRMPVQ